MHYNIVPRKEQNPSYILSLTNLCRENPLLSKPILHSKNKRNKRFPRQYSLFHCLPRSEWPDESSTNID